jgi:hypothetical protein
MKNIKTFEEFTQVNSDEETLGLKGEEIFVETPSSSIDPEDTYDDADYLVGDDEEEDDEEEDDDEEDDADFINTDEDTEDSSELEDDDAIEFDEKF